MTNNIKPFITRAALTLALTVRRATTLTATRAALLLLTMMLTTATAWAGDIDDCELRGTLEGFEDGYGPYNSLTANVQVWYGETQLEYGTDYDIDVEYVESYEVGQTYNATIVGMGDWEGTTKGFTFTFVIPHHNVIFVANGGTGTMADGIVGNDNPIYYLPECGFTAPACLVFDHWEVSYEGITEDPIKQPGDYFTAPYIYQPSDIQTITVTAHWRVADELPAVNYIDADGEQATKQPGEYTVLTGGGATTLGAGWYVATGIINYTGSVTYGGNVHIILIDGCTMNVGTSGVRINDDGIKSNGSTNLTIYGQSSGSGALSVYTTGTFNEAIIATNLTINGGHVTVNTDGWGVYAVDVLNDLTINGGTVSVTGTGGSTEGLYARQNLTINGGSVNATTTNKAIYVRNGAIILGWNKPTDRISITASSYSGTVQVVSGKKLHNGSSFLDGTLGDPATALNGKTLRPAATATYTTADGTAATADAILLDASDNNLPAGNYLATGTLNYTHGITLTGNVTLILADNCHMNVGTSGSPISGSTGIYYSNNATLTITSESLGSDMGTLSVYTTGNTNHGIRVNALTINGGNITADTDGYAAPALNARGALTINGGTVTAVTAGTTAHAIAAAGDFKYNGGNVTATAATGNAIYANGNYTFSWRTPADRITIGATGLYAPDDDKTATFARLFTDGSGNIYTGTLTGTEINALKSVTLQPCTEVTVTMNANGIRTYASKVALDFSQKSSDNSSAELSAYIVSAFDGTAGTLTLSSVDIVPAETGLLLKGTPSTTFTVPLATSASAPSPNYLHGVTDNTTVVNQTDGDYTNFILANGKYGIDWYTLSEAGAIGANKAYLSLPTASLSNSAAGFQWVYEGETTKIERPTPGPSLNGGEWYDLSGRKLNSKPTAKGIYIRNGVKVVIK